MRQDATHIPYEVTISDELRALLGAGNSAGVTSASPARACGESRDVFERRKLRVDGHPPFRASASEILVLSVRGGSGSTVCDAMSDTGAEQLTILQTSDGALFAHFSAEPPSGAPARPTYRLARVESGNDVSVLVRESHKDLEAVMSTYVGPADAKAHERPVDLLKETSATMERAVSSFVASL